MARTDEPATLRWAPADAPVCEAPGRAVRRDAVVRPRVRPLAVVLAEAEAATPGEDGSPARDAAGTGSAPPRPVAPDTAGLAAARATAVRVVGAVAETAAGRRPAHHLAAVVDDATREALLPPLRALAGPSARAGPVRVVAVSAGAVEVAATVHGPTRSRALAARLERDPADPASSTWRVRLLVLL